MPSPRHVETLPVVMFTEWVTLGMLSRHALSRAVSLAACIPSKYHEAAGCADRSLLLTTQWPRCMAASGLLLSTYGSDAQQPPRVITSEVLHFGCRRLMCTHLDHAVLPMGAAEGGVLLAHMLEGGMRGAVGERAQPVPVVHHSVRLVRCAPCCGLPCNSAHTASPQ